MSEKVFKSRFSGSQIEEAVEKALSWEPSSVGTINIPSSVDQPVDLDTLTPKGYYTIDYFLNAPPEITNCSPISVEIGVIDDIKYQFINSNSISLIRKLTEDETWGEWENIENKLYIKDNRINNLIKASMEISNEGKLQIIIRRD